MADRYGIIHEGVLLDEATNEELASRCRPVLFLKTSNPVRSAEVFSSLGIVNYKNAGDHFEISERVNEGGAISLALAQQNIQTLEMRVEGQSLEDYYFRLTGGVPNV